MTQKSGYKREHHYYDHAWVLETGCAYIRIHLSSSITWHCELSSLFIHILNQLEIASHLMYGVLYTQGSPCRGADYCNISKYWPPLPYMHTKQLVRKFIAIHWNPLWVECKCIFELFSEKRARLPVHRYSLLRGIEITAIGVTLIHLVFVNLLIRILSYPHLEILRGCANLISNKLSIWACRNSCSSCSCSRRATSSNFFLIVSLC